jgi:hypothetical protein
MDYAVDSGKDGDHPNHDRDQPEDGQNDLKTPTRRLVPRFHDDCITVNGPACDDEAERLLAGEEIDWC